MFSRRILATALRLQNVRSSHGACGNYQWYLEKLGNREIVGFGYNGDPVYLDRWDVPMPAIRFKETTADIKALREKEKGDWKKLTIDEKKALYRASFCQTFAEMNAPDGEWKSVTGWVLIWCTMALWLLVFLNKNVYPPLPDTFSEERRQAQYERMMAMNVNPITGFSSKKFQE